MDVEKNYETNQMTRTIFY